MAITPTEKRIREIIQADATASAKAISLDLGWGDDAANVRKYLKRMADKGLIQIVPQHIIVPETGKDELTEHS